MIEVLVVARVDVTLEGTRLPVDVDRGADAL